jgi:hypothetical protein
VRCGEGEDSVEADRIDLLGACEKITRRRAALRTRRIG